MAAFIRRHARSVRALARSFVRLLVRSFVRSLLRSFVHSPVRSFIQALVRSFNRLLVDSVIHSGASARSLACKHIPAVTNTLTLSLILVDSFTNSLINSHSLIHLKLLTISLIHYSLTLPQAFSLTR